MQILPKEHAWQVLELVAPVAELQVFPVQSVTAVAPVAHHAPARQDVHSHMLAA